MDKNRTRIILFETRFESHLFKNLEQEKLFKSWNFALELTNEPVTTMFAEPVRREFKSEDGRFNSTVCSAHAPVGALFPQLSLILRVDQSDYQTDQILFYLLGQVPRYRRLTRLLLGLFDGSFREEFFKKPIVDQILVVDPITGQREIIGTDTPVWPIGLWLK